MKTTMTKQELKELCEMTGLTSEKEKQQSQSGINTPAHADADKLNGFVGQFVSDSEGNLGMVDGVHGNMLGMVYMKKDGCTRVGKLIYPSQIRVAKDATATAARKSAIAYYTAELDSLKRRASMHYSIDNPKYLEKLISRYEGWLARLS